MSGGVPGKGGQVAREYCLAHPTASNLMLARMLKADFPLLFKDREAAREKVRYYRGARGDRCRAYTQRSGSAVERYAIPPTDRKASTPFVIGDDIPRWLVVADLHIPYHEPEPIKLALDYAKDAKCKGVLILGDFTDFHQVSYWARDPNAKRIATEMDMAADMLDSIYSALKPKSVVWRIGNHEYRLERYMVDHAAEIWDGNKDLFSLNTFLNLKERGIILVDDLTDVRHHALNMLHGDEYQGTGAAQPARNMGMKAKECTLSAHCHQSGSNDETTLRGTLISNWTVGCLCDLHPRYSRKNKWNWGFAILHTGDQWHVENKRIVNGDVL